jgi:holin-like protein
MSFYRELFIILLMSFVGEAISYLFNLPIPGSVIGMILMFAALQAKII